MRPLLAPLALLLAGCAPPAAVYPPPPQRQILDDPLTRLQPMIEMDDPTSEQFFVRDIDKGAQPGPWRWCGKRPAVKLPLQSTSNYRFHADLAIANETFRVTGPVTVTLLVNDYPLDKITYTEPGQKTIDHPVPMHLLYAMADNELGLEIDKTWQSKPGDPTLGLILVRIGLVQ